MRTVRILRGGFWEDLLAGEEIQNPRSTTLRAFTQCLEYLILKHIIPQPVTGHDDEIVRGDFCRENLDVFGNWQIEAALDWAVEFLAAIKHFVFAYGRFKGYLILLIGFGTLFASISLNNHVARVTNIDSTDRRGFTIEESCREGARTQYFRFLDSLLKRINQPHLTNLLAPSPASSRDGLTQLPSLFLLLVDPDEI